MNKRAIAALAAVALAVVGIAMLISYANGANDRAYNGAKLESVLQVKEIIPADTKAVDLASKVDTVKIPHDAVAKGAIKNLTEISGLVTTTELQPGEQLILSRFSDGTAKTETKAPSDIPKGMQELTISLASPRAVGGTLKIGDTVGVIASYQTKEGDGVTQLIRNRVPILKITAPPNVAGAAPDSGIQLITLAVRTRDAGKIVNAVEFGKVWLTNQNADTEFGQGGSISRNDVTQ